MNELGFEVSWNMLPGLEHKADSVLDSFIELMESHNLSCGGRSDDGKCTHLFVTKNDASCTEEDLSLVREWMFHKWLVEGLIIHNVVGDLIEADPLEVIPAMFCEHANENPATCKCHENCYCKSHTCVNK